MAKPDNPVAIIVGIVLDAAVLQPLSEGHVVSFTIAEETAHGDKCSP